MMKRCLAMGWIVVANSWALGQNPVSVQPPMAVPATSPHSAMPTSMGAGMSMVNSPLPMVVQQYAPITPTVPYPSAMAGSCSTDGCSTGGNRGTCLQRIWGWLTFQPGEPVVPFFQRPNPYRAPLLAYFPCKEPRFPGYDNGVGNGCSTCAQQSVLPTAYVVNEVPQQRATAIPLRDRLAFLFGYSPSSERVVARGPSKSPFVMQAPITVQPTQSEVQPVQHQMNASVPFSKR